MLTNKNNQCQHLLLSFIFCIILLVFSSTAAYSVGLKFKFRVLTKENGLSSSTIQCLFQDSKGYLWIGTGQGLNCYDGYKMSIYLPKENDPAAISSAYILSITEDLDHNIWIGTASGLNKFDRKTNRFTPYLFNPKNKGGLGNNWVRSMVADRYGNLWIGTAMGLNLLERGKNTFTKLIEGAKTNAVLSSPVSCIYQSKNKELWVGTNGAGLYKLRGKKVIQFFRAKRTGGVCSDYIKAITEDRLGNVWIGTSDQGISVYNGSKKAFKHYKKIAADFTSLSKHVIKSMLTDSKGNVLISMENAGLNLYNPNTDNFSRYDDGSLNSRELSQKTINTMLEDSQHNLWLGTHEAGLFIYSPGRYKFDLITTTPHSGGLSNRNIKTFCENDNDKIWIGTDAGGINVWDRKRNTFQVYDYRSGDPKSLGSGAVLQIYKDKKGVIWVSTWGGGLNRYNPKTNDFTRYVNIPENPNSISSNYITNVFEDSQGTFWVATTYGGLNILDRLTGKFRQFLDSGSKMKFEAKTVIAINEDKHGNMWFASPDAGLYKYSLKAKSITNYFNPNSKEGNHRGSVEVIFNDSKGRLWIGLNGLKIYNYKTRTFNPVALSTQLDNFIVFAIQEDSKGNFWISTNNGLLKYNPDKLLFKRYTDADGLQGLEFSRYSRLQLKSGELLFGGSKGFNVFDPDSITNNAQIAPVYFTDLLVGNKRISTFNEASPLRSPISEAQQITLPYNYSIFSVEYASLNYASAEKTQYAYQLEGFDKSWNLVGTERKATYTNLNPGSYILRVKAGSAEGIWGKHIASIKVVIVPPFWITWWFKLLVLFIIGLVLYKILSQRRQTELKHLEEKKKEEIHQSQLQFFTNISHELRTPLTLILGPLQQLMKDKNTEQTRYSYQTMYRNAVRLMGLISEIIDFRKAETGALDLKVSKGSLAELINDLVFDFSEKSKELDISFNADTSLLKTDQWFDKQIIEKIVINLLNNSFKYTPKGGSVEIELLLNLNRFKPAFENELILKNKSEAIEYVYIRVADNGTGISKQSLASLFERYFRITQSHLGSGLGLAFVKTLTLLHKGEIYVYSEKHKGTEIIIAIPASENNYMDTEMWDKGKEEGMVQLESIRYKNEIYHPTNGIESGQRQPSNMPKTAKSILIIDDNEELRLFLRKCLEPFYNISEAVNGVEGLKKTKEETPDLILSDVMMPEMDGIELCRLLKEDLETSHIPLILLTAKDAIDTKISGLGYGADHYFSKPVNMDLLLLSIKNLFDQRKKIKERYLKDYKVEVRELVHSAKDKELMDKILMLIEQQLENPELNVAAICKEVGMSQTKLWRKIKHITGQNINEFVRSVRLKKAAEMMTHEDVLVTEVMYRVGILSKSYFARVFKKEFGISPSEFQKQLKVAEQVK